MILSKKGKRLVLQFLTIPFLLPLIGASDATIVEAQSEPGNLSPAEEFVLREVGAGREANLKDRFPNEKDRTLTSGFVQRLLADQLKGTTISRFGVRIQHAVLHEKLDLKNAEVKYQVRFDTCQFEGGVDLSGSSFSGDLSFSGSKFIPADAEADFSTMQVQGSADFRKTVFAGPADFSFAKIAGNLEAREAQFANREAEVNFNTMKIEGPAFLNNVVFAGPADFGYADIGGNLEAIGAHFTNPKTKVNFNSMKVGHTAFFDKAIFSGGVDFGYADIGNIFTADQAQFTNRGANAYNFSAMKVKGSVFLRNAFFTGPVDFTLAEVIHNFVVDKACFSGRADFGYADIGGSLDAREAQFTSRSGKVSFNTIKVKGPAFLNKVVFAGPADFGYAEVGGNFEASEVHFTNTEAKANFNTMKVGHTAFFDKTVFAGPVDFGYAEVGGNLEAGQTRITESGSEANFDELKVGANGMFQNVFFKGRISFVGAQFQDLIISGAQDGAIDSLESLDLSLAQIRRQIRIENLRVKEMTTTSLRVLGPAQLNELHIERKANLEYSHFLTLRLMHPPKPGDKDGLHLEGMTYQSIDTGSKKNDWEEVLNWIRASEYSAQPYLQLESVLKTQGDPEHADDVYAAGKDRERQVVYGGPGSLGWWKSIILEGLVRYGRSPQWAFYWSAGVIFAGFWVYRRKQDVEPRKPEHAAMPYNPFWFSLSLFLPLVNLDSADIWMARQDSRFRRHYARVHVLLGWILVPIGLAAITGIIK